jgi:hypothetical protein
MKCKACGFENDRIYYPKTLHGNCDDKWIAIGKDSYSHVNVTIGEEKQYACPKCGTVCIDKED